MCGRDAQSLVESVEATIELKSTSVSTSSVLKLLAPIAGTGTSSF